MSDPGLRSEAGMAGRYAGQMPEARWPRGEVRRHCARCEAEVDWLQRRCSKCGAQLRKECPRCHYWVELDATFCVSCRHGFPLPPPPRPTVRLWHDRAEERPERT
jgi:hypothetical protein